MRADNRDHAARTAWLSTIVVLALGFVTGLVGLSGPASVAQASAATAECSSSVVRVSPFMATGTVNRPYSDQIQVFGGGTPPYTFELVQGSLPLGLSMTSSGLVKGTPLLPGESRFTVQVVDSSSPAECATETPEIKIVTGTELEGILEFALDTVNGVTRPGCLQSVINTLLYHQPPGDECRG